MPVQEFADIDVIDLEVHEKDLDSHKFCDIVASLADVRRHQPGRHLGAACAEIEEKLRQRMKIPVFPRRPARHGEHLGARALDS